MDFSRLQASLVGITNDISLAAAQLNFDFTLIKCEAPKEYHQLGQVLSKQRKADAEYGSTHITARRLGALFEGLCPPTPNLLKAYGTRVSETAQHAETTHGPEIGIFSAQSGVDGTTIWAAATSSQTALKVQLLACLLARAWPAAEATSVWVEMVKERREEIKSQFESEEAVPYSTMAAATQADISRSQLAEWDASVRAWLRTADRVNDKNQAQLMQLVDKLNITIDLNMAVYKSVMAVWTSALRSLERIVSGMPQAVDTASSGPPLLALSSWHIYPNLLVINQPSASRRFNDPLVSPGGVLTIGLPSPGETEPRGIFWSLSLAHLNYYGGPVTTEAHLNLTSAKMTFAQFCAAATGCFLGNWGVPRSRFPLIAEFFALARDEICRTPDDAEKSKDPLVQNRETAHSAFLRDKHHWLKILARALGDYAGPESSPDADVTKKLLNFGVKRSSEFLPSPGGPRSFLGFSNPSNVLRCLKGPLEQVKFLQHIAATSGISNPTGLVIRVFDRPKHMKDVQCAVATAFPVSTQASGDGHVYWIPRRFQGRDRFQGGLVECLEENDERRIREPARLSEENHRDNCFEFGGQADPSCARKKYRFVYGDPELAGLFRADSLPRPSLRDPTVEDLVSGMKDGLVSPTRLVEYFEGMSKHSIVTKALKSISHASLVYSSVPDATISPRVLASPIYQTKWAIDAPGFFLDFSRQRILGEEDPSEPPSELQVALACVAYMESGLDISPADLKRVFAFAFEDSIYVSMKVCSPPRML